MSSTCQVDFYLLTSASPGANELACKLATMAWERGHRIHIVTSNPAASDALDQLLWKSPKGRFVPHARADSAETAASPVQISHTAPGETSDVVINLTSSPLDQPGLYTRLLEIVPHLDADRQASREKFKAYRALGLQPATHEIN